MVKCSECKYGLATVLFDHYQDETVDCYYCKVTEDWLSEKQALDNVPCDFYVKKLDDHKTEE